MSTSISKKTYIRLALLAESGALNRIAANFAAGLLSFFLTPPLPASPQPSLAAVLAGAVLAVIGLFAAGGILAAGQPVLQAAGALPGWLLWLGAGLVLTLWIYRRGRRTLTLVTATMASPLHQGDQA